MNIDGVEYVRADSLELAGDRRWVVVRSSPSGVWFGRLASKDGRSVRLVEARKVWSWTGAAATSGLAAQGPGGGKIASPVSVTVEEVCEVIDATPEAVARFAEVAPWVA